MLPLIFSVKHICTVHPSASLGAQQLLHSFPHTASLSLGNQLSAAQKLWFPLYYTNVVPVGLDVLHLSLLAIISSLCPGLHIDLLLQMTSLDDAWP